MLDAAGIGFMMIKLLSHPLIFDWRYIFILYNKNTRLLKCPFKGYFSIFTRKKSLLFYV